jgi:hypothetical protein
VKQHAIPQRQLLALGELLRTLLRLAVVRGEFSAAEGLNSRGTVAADGCLGPRDRAIGLNPAAASEVSRGAVAVDRALVDR